jgi:hypothetical protein
VRVSRETQWRMALARPVVRPRSITATVSRPAASADKTARNPRGSNSRRMCRAHGLAAHDMLVSLKGTGGAKERTRDQMLPSRVSPGGLSRPSRLRARKSPAVHRDGKPISSDVSAPRAGLSAPQSPVFDGDTETTHEGTPLAPLQEGLCFCRTTSG